MSVNLKPVLVWACTLLACAPLTIFAQQPQGNADEKSAALAAQTVKAMGGRENYDATRFISWRFFGRRYHVWDKWTGDYRMESDKGQTVVMNIQTKEGKAWENGEAITDAEKLAEILDRAYKIWINDSYWLVMPYKLRDPGVTLVYAREDQTEDGRAADVVTMTFEAVGVTPENKYEIYFDKESHLVTQWDFFSKADDTEPRFKTPWADWQTYGKIKLSGDRGRSKLADIAVHESVPDHTFETADPVVF